MPSFVAYHHIHTIMPGKTTATLYTSDPNICDLYFALRSYLLYLRTCGPFGQVKSSKAMLITLNYLSGIASDFLRALRLIGFQRDSSRVFFTRSVSYFQHSSAI